jgi:hypothetical protein
MTTMEIKALISEYEAEARFANNRSEEAIESKDEKGESVWSDINTAFADLAYKLKKYLQ